MRYAVWEFEGWCGGTNVQQVLHFSTIMPSFCVSVDVCVKRARMGVRILCVCLCARVCLFVCHTGRGYALATKCYLPCQ